MEKFKFDTDKTSDDIATTIIILGLVSLIANPLLGLTYPNFILNIFVFLVAGVKFAYQVDKATDQFSEYYGGKRLILTSILYGILMLTTVFRMLNFLYS